MKNLLNFIFLTALCLGLFSCSSNIDPELLAKIEQRNEINEDIFDKYTDMNDELIELIEEQNYYFAKLTKIKNSLRSINSRIDSRQKRIEALKNPEVKEGEEAVPATEKALAPHLKRLAEYKEEKIELDTKAEKLLENTQKFTSLALKLRKDRNTIYDQYTESRRILKALNEQAAESIVE
jgi:hypothetical protein